MHTCGFTSSALKNTFGFLFSSFNVIFIQIILPSEYHNSLNRYLIDKWLSDAQYVFAGRCIVIPLYEHTKIYYDPLRYVVCNVRDQRRR